MRLETVAVYVAVVAAVFINGAYGHGRMIHPPGRNTAMNEQRTKNPFVSQCSLGTTNTDDNAQNCGGRYTQQGNNGLCSACGENYANQYPRNHDYTGKFAKKITPVEVYLQGQTITVESYITASHKGWFEFRICNLNEKDEMLAGNIDELTKCFNDEHDTRHFRLKTTSNADKYYGPANDPTTGINQSRGYSVQLKLPSNLVCPNGCSLQWKYVTDNSPGHFPEMFINCADIAIISCADYKAGKIPDYCGYGPTDALKTCDPNAAPAGSNEQQADQGQGNTGCSGGTQVDTSNGDTQNTAPSGGESQQQNDMDQAYAGQTGEGYQNSNTQPSGDEQWQPQNGPSNDDTQQSDGNYGSQNTDSNVGNTQNDQSYDDTQQPYAGNPDTSYGDDNETPNYGNPSAAMMCDECNYDVMPECEMYCEKSYKSKVNHIADSWCDTNCNHYAPNCPPSICTAIWEPSSEYKYKRILNLLRDVLRKGSRDGDLEDDDGPYGK